MNGMRNVWGVGCVLVEEKGVVIVIVFCLVGWSDVEASTSTCLLLERRLPSREPGNARLTLLSCSNCAEAIIHPYLLARY